MTRRRLASIVKAIRYKPGWTVRLDEDIEVTANVPDAYRPRRKPIEQPRAYVVVTPGRLARWNERVVTSLIFDAIQRLEFHEVAEWFKYRGKRIYDPHR